MEFPSGLLTYNIVSETAHGTLSLASEQPSLVYSSVFEYTPGEGFIGTDAFTYEVWDTANPAHKSAVATVSITVEDTREDSDGDGLSDAREGDGALGTDPNNPDSDGWMASMTVVMVMG